MGKSCYFSFLMTIGCRPVTAACAAPGPHSDIHTEILLVLQACKVEKPLQGHSRSLVISNSKNRNQAERMISTGQLHTLPHFHFQPINVVVFDDPSGKTHLGRSLALRCFQRLSLPNLATRPCR